jgi:acetyl esterase/lipase
MNAPHLRWSIAPTVVLAFFIGLPNVYPQEKPPATVSQDLRDFIPASISPEAHAIYEKTFPALDVQRKTMVIPDTQEGFDALNAQLTAIAQPATDALIKKLGVITVEYKLGDVGVFETKPPNYKDDGTVLIRVHGGGFVLGSARATAGSDAVMALLTGKRILSVDYTLAPRGKWQLVTDQVVTVYKAVLAQGYQPSSIGMYGDSAGGNIVPASILKLRDQGIPLPGAVVLLSPCVDVELNGDTETTLAHADPILNEQDIVKGLKAYADPADWKNPYVSPIYGDFKKGFPPVLIQVGTKELLFSDSVRLYQAIKMAGGEAELDAYEGMVHVFQGSMKDTPEGKQAFAEIQRFWLAHLQPAKK